LWIGTDNGLSLLKNGEFNAVGGNSGLPAAHKNINVLLEESGGALLAGTKGGLIRFENGRFRPFLIANSSMDMEVLSLYEDPEKNLWIGTKGSGLICFRNGTATPITTGAGLHNNYIFSILEDNGGNLWMSSYRGVFRAAKKELLQFAAGKTKKIKSIYFDEKDGMKSSECMPAGYPAACRTSNGRICFPTVKGIAVFDPAAIRIDKKPPRVLIEDVIVDNEAVKKDDTNGIVISAEKKMLEFYFTALSFRSPERIRFKYKLEGFEKEWVETEPQQKRTAYYINLKPGAYRFRVIAGSSDGIWNTEGARFEFQIKTSFFKQPAFYILLVLALLSVAGGILRFYINKKRRTKKTKKYKTSALDAERADEILPKLLVLMEKEKIYLNADLTLKKLSERLMIHYNHLSQIINEKLQFSFNDFVNKYRIEEAKKKLLDPAEGKKTVLEIAYDTGFYSKSVFNTAFKKFTGMTPSQFKKKKR
jgi:AraC-like DNA-binding protein